MNRPLKVFFFPTANAGVVFYRMLQYFRYIKKDPTMNPAMDKFDPKRVTPYEWQFKQGNSTTILVEIEKLVSQADILVFGYVMSDFGVAILQGIRTMFPDKPMLVEIDDYCNEVNSYSPAAPSFKPHSEPTNAIMEQLCMSDGIIVSTPYLARLYKDLNSVSKVIPNGVDFDIWDKLKSKKRNTKNIRIGWCGAASHSEDLRYISKTALKIVDKYPNVEFYFLGGVSGLHDLKHPRIICEQAWFDIFQYPQGLKDRNFDIGIAPLLDNNFNRAKSNLRWLEYSALKIPTVCSRVEDFKRTIVDRKTGYLATEPEEWFDKLSLLIEDKKKCKEVGLNAYNEVKKNFNIEIISKDYSSYLKGFHDEFKRTKGKVSANDAGSTNNGTKQR